MKYNATNRKKIVRLLISAAFGILLGWLIYLRLQGHSWPTWTGFGENVGPDGEVIPAKSLWDWMEVLIIPLVLAVVAYFLSTNQKKTELDIAKREREQERDIAQKNREKDIEIAADRLREEALQSYLDKMGQLLLKEDLLATKDDPEAKVRKIAQVQTVTTLRKLDTTRQNLVIPFLRDAGLADFLLLNASMRSINMHAVRLFEVNLSGANLTKANLSAASLAEANLSGAYLSGANLSGAYLFGANLSGANLNLANLSEANLSWADLSEADLSWANLKEANLLNAKLIKAKLLRANLSEADLIDANLGHAWLGEANMLKANLLKANLSGANLSGAYLVKVKLNEANLNEADLSEANLSEADLSGATVTPEQLSQAKSLVGVKMPDGSVHY